MERFGLCDDRIGLAGFRIKNRSLHVAAFAFFSRAFSDQWSFDFGEKLNRYILALEAHSDAACESWVCGEPRFELSTLIAFQFLLMSR